MESVLFAIPTSDPVLWSIFAMSVTTVHSKGAVSFAVEKAFRMHITVKNAPLCRKM